MGLTIQKVYETVGDETEKGCHGFLEEGSVLWWLFQFDHGDTSRLPPRSEIVGYCVGRVKYLKEKPSDCLFVIAIINGR